MNRTISKVKMKTQRSGRGRARGFTLTELMVSLVMGMIVSLAAIALSASANTAFQEQARSSTTEMSVRSGAERLRQDLMRVSYMSTGNILLDPKIARFSTTGLDGGAAPNAPLIARYPQLQALRGLTITDDGGSTLGGVRSDMITMVGNYTTDDSYAGEISTGTVTAGTCSGAIQVVTLNPLADAAVYQLAGMTTGAVVDAATMTRFLANARNAFLPVAGSTFMGRVTDANGCYHFVEVCAVQANPLGDRIDVLLSGPPSGRAVLYNPDPTAPADIGNCGAFDKTQVQLAPLQAVRYSIQPSPATVPLQITSEVQKTDLVRQLLDFNGAPAGPPEVVAEYAVDLKFGIVVDDPAQTNDAKQVVYDHEMGSANVVAVTAGAAALQPPFPRMGPQRVRSVSFRLAVRTALGDQNYDLPETGGTARVCVNTGCTRYARVRTITSEVALVNQASMFY